MFLYCKNVKMTFATNNQRVVEYGIKEKKYLLKKI